MSHPRYGIFTAPSVTNDVPIITHQSRRNHRPHEGRYHSSDQRLAAHKTQHRNTKCSSLLDCICCVFGTAVCAYNTSRSTKVVVLWLWLIVVSVAIGLFFALVLYSPYQNQVSPAEERVIKKGFSTLFCNKIELSSPRNFNAYLLDSMPELANERRVSNTSVMNVYLTPDKGHHWKFHLLADSKVTVWMCSTDYVRLYFMKSKRNFNKWKEHKCHSDNNCLLELFRVAPPSGGKCDGNQYFQYSLNVSERGNYYITMDLPEKADLADVEIFFTTYRNHFNISQRNVIEMCENDHNCKFQLNAFSHEVVVYNISSDAPFWNHLKVQCYIRDDAYYILFAGSPLCLGWVISAIIMLYYKDTGQTSKKTRPAPDVRRGGPRIRRRFVSVPPGYETLEEEERDVAQSLTSDSLAQEGDTPTAYHHSDSDTAHTSHPNPIN